MTRKPRGERNGERMTRKPRGERNGERMTRKPRGERNGERMTRKPRGERNGERMTRKPRGERNGERMTRRPRGERNGKGMRPGRGTRIAKTRGPRGNRKVRPHPGRVKTVAVRDRGPRRVSRTIVRQPIINNYVRAGRRGCAPIYANVYDPYIYTDYRVRRCYRRYNYCSVPFLSFGFFLTRPYSYYDYAQVGYSQPFVYGEDQDYRPAPAPVNEVGGPEAEAIQSEGLAASPAQGSSTEQLMLTELSAYVEENSVEGSFQVRDAAFDNQIWNLELTHAPAVYLIDQGLYSVVAGFEGTLGDSNMPANVGLEFFMVRKDGGWDVRDVWIVSANGIARDKQFQSPVHPQVKTWQPGVTCPFSGQPMVPVTEATSHG